MRFWTLLLVLFLLVGFVFAQEPEVSSEEPEPINQPSIRMDDALRLLAREAKINLVLPFELDKKISITNERRVDALKLLQIVCSSHGYQLVKDGDIYTVLEMKKKETEGGQPSQPTSPGMEMPTTTGVVTQQEGVSTANFQLLRTRVEQVESKVRSMLSIGAIFDMNRDSNAFYVEDKPENVTKVKNYVDFLNMDPAAAFEARVEQRTFKINRIPAENVSDMLSKLVTEKGKFVFDKASMTLTVVESREVLDTIDQFIKTADQVEPQLYIRCHFVEVNLTAGTKLATEFQQESGIHFADDVDGGPAGFNLMPTDINDLSKTDNAVFNIFSSKNNITASMAAIANRDNYRLLSSPNLLCYNKQKSSINITTEIPYKQSTTTTDSGTASTSTVEFKEVGITMEVTPEIYSDGSVKLNLKPEVSEDKGRYEGTPVIRKKTIESNVLVKDGQVVVIGGLLEDQVKKSRYKVPLLGDIPLLGLLFSREQQDMVKTELVIFLHVTLMNDTSVKNMADKKWREQEEKFQKFDTEYEFYPHLKERLDMQKLNPRYDQDTKASATKAKVADNFEFAPHK